MNPQSNRKHPGAWTALVTAAVLCLALAPAAAAQDVAQVRTGSSTIDFNPVVSHGGLVLTVSGPDGFHHRAEFGSGEAPSFSIFDEAGAALADGSYKYQLVAAPTDVQRREALEANRLESRAARQGIVPLVQSGSFAVIEGVVVAGGESEPDAGAGVAGGNQLATKDQVIPDDLIVQGSLCVGFDCVNNESFGFDTIRMKENNTRIKFEDTSTTAGFPSADWQLTANDSASGGLNKFSIEQTNVGLVPFTVEGGASNNSLYVDTGLRVGVGTSTPVLNLHVATSNTPGLRLEQTNAGGFTAQTWDVAGNEANFFVRSVTTGSQLPFRIRPGAPTSSIDIAASGNVGVGTASPDAAVDIERAGGGAAVSFLRFTNTNGPARLEFRDDTGSVNWDFRTTSGDAFVITRDGSGTNELLLNSAGNMTISGDYFSATCTSPGSPCAPDYVFAPDYELMPLQELRAFIEENRHLPNVPSETDLREARQINLSKFQLTLLEKVEELTLYTLSLHDTIEELQADRDAKSEALAALKESLEILEAVRSEE